MRRQISSRSIQLSQGATIPEGRLEGGFKGYWVRCSADAQEEFVKRDGHIMATDLMLWCANNEPAAPAPGKDDFHMETVCTLVNIIGNAARSSVKVKQLNPSSAAQQGLTEQMIIRWAC